MNWYYAKNGNQNGPLPTEDMKDRIAMGEISPTDLAWSEGMADWMPVSQIPELKVETPARQESFTPPPPAATAESSPYQTPSSAPGPVSPVSMVPGQVPSQGLAIASMICGILGLLSCCLWFLSGPAALAAIVMGHIALSKIKGNPAAYGGKGMAKAGLITGYLGLLATLLFTAFMMWLGTLSPEKVQQMDWIPEQFRTEFQRSYEEQMRLRQGSGTP